MSNSLWLQELQHARHPDPSPTPTQTHVHQVGDAIQPSHPLSSPSPPAPNPSQHQGLFQWVNSSHVVAKVLEFQLQHQSFPWIFRTDFLYDWLVGSHCSPRNSQESSPAPQFKSINSALGFLYSPTLKSYMTTGKTIGLTRWTSVAKVMSLLFNMLSNFVIMCCLTLVITFLPRSKHLLISWLQSPSAVTWSKERKKERLCFHCFPIFLLWSDATGCHDLSFLNVEF